MVATLAKSVKYSGVAATDSVILGIIASQLTTLVETSKDLDVKKNAYEGISTIIHNIPLLM